jgi:acyl carrier protein
MPPIKGVIHAAMVLDDALIANLDRERFTRVMRAKIDTAANLDRLIGGAALDYFVLFSSATTVVGNPGQAPYVAANAYLESLARARRARGLPALAVAWGAIEDAGYLTRKADVREKLSRRLGQRGITAREALDALGRLLVQGEGQEGTSAAVVFAPIDWVAARRHLQLLSSPVYSQVITETEVSGVGEVADAADLVALVRGREPRAAREAVGELLAAEVARILKLPVQEIGPQRPLVEIGMDSLMGLELRLSVERRFGVELPLVAISDTTTLASIAEALVSRIQEPEPLQTDRAADPGVELLRRHVTDDLDVDELSGLGEVVRSRTAEIERIL